MTIATRITKRTPVVTVPARELRAGATLVTRSERVCEVAAVGLTRDRDRVRIAIANMPALPVLLLPAHAPVQVYAEP